MKVNVPVKHRHGSSRRLPKWITKRNSMQYWQQHYTTLYIESAGQSIDKPVILGDGWAPLRRNMLRWMHKKLEPHL